MHRRNHPPSQFVIVIVYFCLLLTGEGSAQEKKDWKDRFFAEAPKRWEEYIRFARNLQVISVANRYCDADGSLEASFRTEIKQTKGAFLRVLLKKIGTESKAEAQGANPSYSFKLKRRRPDRGWIVTDLDISDQSTTSIDEQRKYQELYFQLMVCQLLMLENLWLPTLIQDKDFKIKAVNFQEIDRLPVVRLDFDYLKPDEEYPGKTLRIKGGWMVLDPAHDWILREYSVQRRDPENYFDHRTFQIREGNDGHPIITQTNFQILVKREKSFDIALNIKEQREDFEQAEVPFEEFTLSAFDLPEPPGVQVERSSRLYLWIALSGIVCLCIGGLIRWQIRRRRVAL